MVVYQQMPWTFVFLIAKIPILLVSNLHKRRIERQGVEDLSSGLLAAVEFQGTDAPACASAPPGSPVSITREDLPALREARLQVLGPILVVERVGECRWSESGETGLWERFEMLDGIEALFHPAKREAG